MKITSKVFCLASLVLSTALVGCSTENAPDEDERGTKVLMIGNSFSISLLHHLPQVAADRGVELDLTSLYIGGCSLERHWSNATNDADKTFRPYKLGRNRFGEYTQRTANVREALQMAKWDIVTVQQASHESWKSETYSPCGDNLIALIRTLAPQAKIYVQETWSYTPWDKRLAQWGIDQNRMYAKLHEAYADFAKRHGLEVIPFGTAVQEWRKRLPVKYTEKSFGGDVVGGGRQEERDHFKRDVNGNWMPNCDVFHLGRRGEYFQALVWAHALFGVDLGDLSYRPDFVTDSDFELMKKIAGDVK